MKRAARLFVLVLNDRVQRAVTAYEMGRFKVPSDRNRLTVTAATVTAQEDSDIRPGGAWG